MEDAQSRAALAVIDMQEDFCEPNGSLAVSGGRSVASVINDLLDWPGFVLKVGTRDHHPPDHISFASNHPGAQPFTSSHTIQSPSNAAETQTTYVVRVPSSSALPRGGSAADNV